MPRQNRHRPPHEESQVSLASTVFWLLCVLGALVAQIVALATYWAARANEAEALSMVHRVSLFIGVMLGALGLITLPIVLRARKTPPPRSVILFAAVVCGCSFVLVVACG